MPPPPLPSRPISRRVLLRAGLVLPAAGLVACTGEPAPPPAPHPDVVLADEAAARERALLAAYDRALVLAPALADRLTAIRAQHAEHLDALGVPELPAPSPPASAPAGRPTPSPTPELPSEPAALLAALAELERATGLAHAAAAVEAGSGLAVVLASAAASEASHPVALR